MERDGYVKGEGVRQREKGDNLDWKCQKGEQIVKNRFLAKVGKQVDFVDFVLKMEFER